MSGFARLFFLALVSGVYVLGGCARKVEEHVAASGEVTAPEAPADSAQGYQSISEVDPSAAELALRPNNAVPLARLTPEAFISQLASFGFQAPGISEAQSLFNRRKEFSREFKILSQGGHRPLVAYYVLFKSSADATRFIQLRQEGLAQRGTTPAAVINSLVNVCRKANFVAIFVSEDETMREDYPRRLWHFGSENMNL